MGTVRILFSWNNSEKGDTLKQHRRKKGKLCHVT